MKWFRLPKTKPAPVEAQAAPEPTPKPPAPKPERRFSFDEAFIFSNNTIALSALVGATTGGLAALFVYVLNQLFSLWMGGVMGYNPPGLVGEQGLEHTFKGPQWPWLPVFIVVVFAVSGYFGSHFNPKQKPPQSTPTTDPEAPLLIHDTIVDAPNPLETSINSWLPASNLSASRPRGKHTLLTILGSLLQISSGSSFGREGPIALMGLWLGNYLGRVFHFKGESRFLPFAGLAAAFASVLHAPMAGALLASEMVFKGLAIQAGALAPAMIGALAGFTVYGAFMGYGPLLELHINSLDWTHVLFGLLVGLSCGWLGNLWQTLARWLQAPLKHLPFWLQHLIFGALVAAAVAFYPESSSSALPWVGLSVAPLISNESLLTIAGVQMLLLIVGSASKIYGGYITPTIALGGLLGIALSRLPMVNIPAEAAAIAGMCAMLSGVARAPFAAVVLGGELAGYSMIPIVLGASFFAYGVSIPHGMFELPEVNSETHSS